VVTVVRGVLPWSDAGQAIGRGRRPAPGYQDEHGHAMQLASLPGPRRWGFAPELLTAYRTDAGMTYRDLARAAGMSWKVVASIERAAFDPSADQLRNLADALGVDDFALCWA
jgi:hypothetical protein